MKNGPSMHCGLPLDGSVAWGCFSRYTPDLPVLQLVSPAKYPHGCFLLDASRCLLQGPLASLSSLTHTFTRSHKAMKGLCGNLGRITYLASLTLLGLPLLLRESLRHLPQPEG